MLKAIVVVLVLCVFCQQNAAAGDQDSCPDSNGLTFICGLTNAEDLVSVPNTDWVLSSGMAAGGGIYLIDSAQKTWSQVYTGTRQQVRHDAARYSNCSVAPVPESFVTHGLHIRPGDNGHSTLYVVGHVGREAIEVFDIDANHARPGLTWIGCVPMPEGLGANSVTSLKDGSLLATVLWHPGQTFADVLAGKLTGAVYRWSPGDSGFEVIRGSELPGNNGIEVSADEREIFVVSSGLRTISAFANSNPTRLLRATPILDYRPDNVHMTTDGHLITAGPSNVDHDCGELDTDGDVLEEFAKCPKGSVAATYDPVTLKETQRWSSPADPVFSNATMALMVGDGIWIGSFSGNRIGVIRKVLDKH